MSTTEPTTTHLSPQQYALALGYKKKLESQLLQKEIRDLHAQLAPQAEISVTIEETTTYDHHPEPTTPIHPQATTLTLPPAPEERTYSPIPLDRQQQHPTPRFLTHEPGYSPTPLPRNLPLLDPSNAESVKRWAETRWPEPVSVANRRKAQMEREVYGSNSRAMPGEPETPHQRRLRMDRERQRAKRNARKQPKSRTTGTAVSPSNGLEGAGTSNEC